MLRSTDEILVTGQHSDAGPLHTAPLK
ncbi:hypothetical protein SUNI508_14116 [Seiridium unicorne]|uniref:Uncharacterized protein n=1 Tax=Seiridium unicorne TaxID=138068 RepID=A0ABR2UVU7_9PEZI